MKIYISNMSSMSCSSRELRLILFPYFFPCKNSSHTRFKENPASFHGSAHCLLLWFDCIFTKIHVET